MSTRSFSPRDGLVVCTAEDTDREGVAQIARASASVAPTVAATSPGERAGWLNAVADAVEQHTTELVALADQETALGVPRLTGELARMTDQLRFYGRVAVEGSYLGVTIDDATASTPRLVRVSSPLGPVAVFGSSNFPFGFGVLGTDTASALASGCPVVAKAHSAHLGTCLRLVQIAQQALREAGAPEHLIDLVIGREAGTDLVRAPEISAVAFTGSQAVGMLLWRIANERERVILVFAEMGTVNPTVLTPRGAGTLAEVAKGFVGSFTLGSGQFCTKPGILFAPAGCGAPQAVAAALAAAAPDPVMLTAAIAADATSGIAELSAAGAELITRVPGSGEGWSADAAVLAAPVSALRPGSRLLEECFGPVALVVEYTDLDDLVAGIRSLQPSLAGAVFGGGDDDDDVASVLTVLAAQVGRVTVGDWPTGVAWTWAQHHGGPWPATSQPATTSVGAASLLRFMRPVSYQSVPAQFLPAVARQASAADNPWGIARRIDGHWEAAS